MENNVAQVCFPVRKRTRKPPVEKSMLNTGGFWVQKHTCATLKNLKFCVDLCGKMVYTVGIPYLNGGCYE